MRRKGADLVLRLEIIRKAQKDSGRKVQIQVNLVGIAEGVGSFKRLMDIVTFHVRPDKTQNQTRLAGMYEFI